MPLKLKLFNNAKHTLDDKDLEKYCDIVILDRGEKVSIKNGGIILQGELQEILKDEITGRKVLNAQVIKKTTNKGIWGEKETTTNVSEIMQ